MTDLTGDATPSRTYTVQNSTDAEVRVLRCAQCTYCVNGPDPEMMDRVIDLDGVPLTVRYPRCLTAGHLYARARMAVCANVRRWDL